MDWLKAPRAHLSPCIQTHPALDQPTWQSMKLIPSRSGCFGEMGVQGEGEGPVVLSPEAGGREQITMVGNQGKLLL